jgi:two-component system, NtrC family, response regulator AtoC
MATPFVFGSHARLKDLERRMGFIARSELPVWIEGASGTGKEALAELLHELSGTVGPLTRIVCRQSGPMLYPAALHANGLVDLGELCSKTPGTVFLKNVHLLSPAAQEQLLLGLEQVADPEGNGAPAAGARILSSATESLEPLVSRGEWSAALYHRLSVYRVCLPRLRERRDDIPLLFDQMVRRAVNGNCVPPVVPDRLLQALMGYDWPGNLRELQNIARTYVVTAQADETIAELKNRAPRTPDIPQLPDASPLKEQVKRASQRLESEIILRTLERHRWNRRRAAESLHISYRSLLYKMKSCNLRIQPQPTPEGQ